MSAPERDADGALPPPVALAPELAAALDALRRDPKSWAFHAAVRAAQAAFPATPGVGRADALAQEPLRFRQRPSMAFIAAPIVSAGFVADSDPPVFEIEQVFFGGLGPNGPLPAHVTTDAIRELRDGRPFLSRFLDLFTHRMTAFLHRAWEMARPAASRELDARDPWPAWIGALYGGGPDALRDRDSLPDDLRRYASGWLAAGRRSAAAAEGVLGIVIGRGVTVEQFVPEWLPMRADEQARLGAGACALGVDAALGPRFFSVSTRLRARTEALDYETFASLLPDGPRHAAARAAMRSLMGLAWGWELKPVLAADQIPDFTLNGERRLGWDSWLGATGPRGDGDDVTLQGDFSLSQTGAL